MQRAVAASCLSDDVTEIINPSYCDDSLASLDLAEKLGAEIFRSKDKLRIKGGIRPVAKELSCGESGLCLRMFSPVAALSRRELILRGTGTLCRRPISMVEKPLRDLGVQCESLNGYPPLKLKGPLRGGQTVVDGSITSQFLTGLLLALPCVGDDSVIYVEGLKSRSYIDITLKMMDDFSICIVHENYQKFVIAGNQKYRIGRYRIEGDWSAASLLLVAGAIGGSVCVQGLNMDSAQGDKRILEAIEASGASLTIETEGIRVEKNNLKAFSFDATDCPDLFPPLVVLACTCEGQTRIKGLERLAFKESNRAGVLQREFSNLGAKIRLKGDWLEIQGSKLSAGIIDSHHDHRIVMAAAVAGIISEGEISIKNSGCVSKSYPAFFEDFKWIGGKVHE
jgi:3-phosphoshikimate 1-carboxyvinyltransferase